MNSSVTSTEIPFGEIRQREIRRLLTYRYGVTLPDDDAGRDDLAVMLRHLAHLRDGARRVANYCDVAAPWLTGQERESAVTRALASHPPRYTADELAKRLDVTWEERNAVGVTTIGAVDFDRVARAQRRRELARQRQAKRRRKSGHKTRAEYVSSSVSKAKPWIAEGTSRATWYRRQHT